MDKTKVLILAVLLTIGGAAAQAQSEETQEDGECREFCVPCPSTGNCTSRCHLNGNCREFLCSTVDECVSGFHWNESACRCVPDNAREQLFEPAAPTAAAASVDACREELPG